MQTQTIEKVKGVYYDFMINMTPLTEWLVTTCAPVLYWS